MIKINFLHRLMLVSVPAMLLFSSCHHENDDNETRQPYVVPDSLFHTLTIDTANTQPIVNTIKLNGMVDYNAQKTVTVYPLVTGNVQGVTIAPGDYVKAGQVLGTVKSAEVANYNSALISAEANVQQTARALSQQKDLYKSGLASEVDVANAKAAYDQAVATKVAAQKVLNINGNNPNGEYQIKAPVEGFVVQMSIANGMAIRSDNNAGLLTIADLKNVWVQANVYEQNIEKVHKGDSVSVTVASYPDKVFRGRVDELMNVLDPNSKTMKMRIDLPNPGYLLKPQMFATVSLNDRESQKATSVSSKALVFDNSQYYVLTVAGKKNVQIQPVQLLSDNGSRAYIKAGLQPGQKVIASNALLIYGSLNN